MHFTLFVVSRIFMGRKEYGLNHIPLDLNVVLKELKEILAAWQFIV